jgi:hypothetical protein
MAFTRDERSGLESFRPVAVSARWVIGLMMATLVFAGLAAALAVKKVELLARASAGDLPPDALEAFGLLEGLLALFQLVVIVANVVAFLVWFHRAHRNLPSLEASPITYGSGWTIGGFLVPILNLVRPMQVMREVWHGSNPAKFEPERDGRLLFGGHESTPVLVGWWWGLFLASNFVGNAVFRLAMGREQDLWHMQRQSGLEALSYAIDIPAAVVAVFLVRRVTAWQSERAALVAKTRELQTGLGVAGASGLEPLTPTV